MKLYMPFALVSMAWLNQTAALDHSDNTEPKTAHSTSSHQQSSHAQSVHGSGQRCVGVSDSVHRIPFTRADSGHLLIDGVFNKRAARAVLDTGGIGVGGVVSQDFYDKISTGSAMKRGEVQGANHSRAMNIAQLDSVGVPEISAEQLNVVISPKPILPNGTEALIGSEFLCNFLVELNFKTNELVLHPKSQSIQSIIQSSSVSDKKWGISANISHIAGALVIDWELDGHRVKGIIDTGARHSIMNWNAAKLLGLTAESDTVVREKNEAEGLHGNAEKEAMKVVLKSVGMAENRQVASLDMWVRISDMGAFKPLVNNMPAINLGVDFFENRNLLIDYERGQIAISN